MKPPLAIGFVGLGERSVLHAKNLRSSEATPLAVWTSSDSELGLLEQISEVARVQVYADWSQVVGRSRLVYLRSSGRDVRKSVLEGALENGAGVLAEGPESLVRSDLLDLHGTAPAWRDSAHRYGVLYREMAHLVRGDLLGGIRHYWCTRLLSDLYEPNARDELLLAEIDLAQWITGEELSVRAADGVMSETGTGGSTVSLSAVLSGASVDVLLSLTWDAGLDRTTRGLTGRTGSALLTRTSREAFLRHSGKEAQTESRLAVHSGRDEEAWVRAQDQDVARALAGDPAGLVPLTEGARCSELAARLAAGIG